jgi:hypothetical protein
LIRSTGLPCPDVDYRTDPENGWGGLFENGLEVVSVAGRHDQLLGTGLEAVARLIREATASIRAR